MNQRGFTLLELLIIVALIGLIVGIAVPLTLEVVRNARATNQIQTVYGNFTEARQRAIQHSRVYLLQFTDQSFDVYEDTNSDGTAQSTEKIPRLSLTNFRYPLAGTIGSDTVSSSPVTVAINRRGLLEPTGLVHVNEDGRLNCIDIAFTRIGLGKYDGTRCKVN